MKKFFVVICLAAMFLLVGCKTEKNQSMTSKTSDTSEQLAYTNYKNGVKEFTIVTPSEILNNSLNKPAIIYFGRITCPFCREFVPMLSTIDKKVQKKIFYLNTEDTEKDSEIQKVRGMFQIKTVPSLVYVKSDNSYEKFDVENSDNQQLENWLSTK